LIFVSFCILWIKVSSIKVSISIYTSMISSSLILLEESLYYYF